MALKVAKVCSLILLLFTSGTSIKKDLSWCLHSRSFTSISLHEANRSSISPSMMLVQRSLARLNTCPGKPSSRRRLAPCEDSESKAQYVQRLVIIQLCVLRQCVSSPKEDYKSRAQYIQYSPQVHPKPYLQSYENGFPPMFGSSSGSKSRNEAVTCPDDPKESGEPWSRAFTSQ